MASSADASSSGKHFQSVAPGAAVQHPPVQSAEQQSEAPDPGAVRALAEQQKATADGLFKRKLFSQAQSAYLDALAVLPPRYEPTSSGRDGIGADASTALQPPRPTQSDSKLVECRDNEDDVDGNASESPCEAEGSTGYEQQQDADIVHLRAVLYATYGCRAGGKGMGSG